MPATAPQGFRSAAKKKEARPVAEFFHEWTDDEDEEKVLRRSDYHLTQPTEEQLFMVAALIGDDENGAAGATAMMDLLHDSMPSAEYRDLRARLADEEDPLDMEYVSWLVERAMERWSGFPTKPSPVSSTSPTSTGTNSTGRVRGQGSTRSASPSRAS